MKYILAIDQGTTGSTALLIGQDLRVAAKVNQEYPQIYPKPGWVEHNPEDIWQSVLKAISGALVESSVSPKDIAAIGITNQRETTVLWEGKNAKPVYNAIVWQCRRTAEHCERLKKEGYEDLFRRKTGLVLDAYFSGTKITWLLDHVPGVREKAGKGQIKFGTIDSYLVFRLTGGEVHTTDVSNASRTLLMDLKNLAWDDELLKILTVPREILPTIFPSSTIYGVTKNIHGLPDGIPIAGIAGDQQAALFGQACFEPGQAKCTYGTGAFLLVNTGKECVPSKNGMLTTVAWQINDQVSYALEGSTFIAGAAVQWLRDGLGMIKKSSEIEPLARTVSDSGGVVFVPAFVGLGAPHWNPNARGMISGITRGTTKAHLARATLEGIAHQIADLIGAMERDFGKPISSLRVDGGAAADSLLMQIQSDLLDRELVRPTVVETTAMGAAFLAGLATEVWKDAKTIAASWKEDARFKPKIGTKERQERLAHWKRAIERA